MGGVGKIEPPRKGIRRRHLVFTELHTMEGDLGNLEVSGIRRRFENDAIVAEGLLGT